MSARPKRFLSLKWKALYLSTTLFFLLTLGFLLFGKTYIDRQFNVKRDTDNHQYYKQLDVFVEQSAQRLQQLASAVASFEGMPDAVLSGDGQLIQRAFEEHWWRFELDGAVDSAAFYNLEGRLLAEWGQVEQHEDLVRHIIEEEAPAWEVNCEANCQILAGIPLLVDGRFETLVVFTTSLTDIILNFNAITGADIGIITINSELGGKASWLDQIVAMTEIRHNRPLLQAYAEVSAPPEERYRTQYEQSGMIYELLFLPVAGAKQTGDSRMVIISNITEEVIATKVLFRNVFIGALFGLIISELILLSILWKPTTELQRVVDALPLLAENNFDIARSSFQNTESEKLVTDESDVLKSTALNLSYQLEALHSLLNNRAIQLEARGVELETEKNFVLGLLNTAHALILTQDSRGEILMINQHGETLLHSKAKQLLGRDFAELLADDDDKAIILRQLKSLRQGMMTELHHESRLVGEGGQPRFMSWFHSRLPDRGDGEHHILTVAIDISERRVAEENLGWLASHDSLTGLLNRRRFEDELEQVMASCHRYNHSGALLFFDLDQFKDVNDSSGHQVGDELLKRVAETLKATAGQSDVVARLGGDEFAIILQESDEMMAGETADKFTRALMKIAVPGHNRIHRISASIGVVLFPQHGDSQSEILSNADIAMYQAKEAGRNTWKIFNEDAAGKERIQERVYWNDRVKQILNEESFDVVFQPIVRVLDGKASHYEALLRIEGDNGQLTGPQQFIAAAERGGFMQAMDEKVIAKVMSYMHELTVRGEQARVSINLSGLSFRNENLLAHIERCLTHYGIDANDIIFEITETAALADMEHAVQLMSDIRALGCKFALDDFGVGFSSLHYLKRLPVDFLKIDGSFIRDIHNRRDDRILVKALVDIATEFGQTTVAEFVDSQAALETLRELRVDYAQGYHVGKPQLFEQLWPHLKV